MSEAYELAVDVAQAALSWMPDSSNRHHLEGRLREAAALHERERGGTVVEAGPIRFDTASAAGSGVTPAASAAVQLIVRAADRLAAAVASCGKARRIEVGHLDARSEAGDALLDYDGLTRERELLGVDPREGRIGFPWE